MKKILFSIAFAAVMALNGYSQVPCTISLWPETAGNANNYTDGYSMTTDGLGNVYVAGVFRSDDPGYPNFLQSSITIGGSSFTAPHTVDYFFVAKYDKCGLFKWVAYGDYQQNQYHGANPVYVDVDSLGNNVYVTSSFYTDLEIVDGTGAVQVVLISGSGNSFISKFSGNNGAHVNTIATTFSGPNKMTVTGSGVYLINSPRVYKYDLNLSFVSSVNISTFLSSGGLTVDGIDSDQLGNIFITGSFYGTFAGIGGTSTGPGSIIDVYILKLNPALSPVYAQKAGANGLQTTLTPNDIYVNGSNIYLTGLFAVNSGAPFPLPYPVGTDYGAYVCKFTDLGITAVLNWGKKLVNPYPNAVSGNPADVYVAGDGFVEHYNSASGAALPGPSTAGDANDLCYNNLDATHYVIGSFSGSLVLNATVTAYSSYTDMYTARLNSTGAYHRKGQVSGESAAANGTFGLYPNPAGSRTIIDLSLTGTESTDISLTDITGKLVRSIPAAGLKQEVDLSELPAGFYIVRVSTVNGKMEKKLLKL
jgi:hypothetical protein